MEYLVRKGYTSWIGDTSYKGDDKKKGFDDGFYLLTICDRDGRNSSLFLPSNDEIFSSIGVPYIGEMKDGVMREFITETELSFVDDVDIANTDGVWCYGEACYINARPINSDKLAHVLETIQECPDGVDIYSSILFKQIEDATMDREKLLGNSHNSIRQFKKKYNPVGIRERYLRGK